MPIFSDFILTAKRAAAAPEVFTTFSAELETCINNLALLEQEHRHTQEKLQNLAKENKQEVPSSLQQTLAIGSEQSVSVSEENDHVEQDDIFASYSQGSFEAFKTVANRLHNLSLKECLSLKREKKQQQLKKELEGPLSFLDPLTWVPFVVDELSYKQALILESFFDAGLRPEWLELLPNNIHKQTTLAQKTLKTRIVRYKAALSENKAKTQNIQHQIDEIDQLMQPIIEAIRLCEASTIVIEKAGDIPSINNTNELREIRELTTTLISQLRLSSKNLQKEGAATNLELIRSKLKKILTNAHSSNDFLIFTPYLSPISVIKAAENNQEHIDSEKGNLQQQYDYQLKAIIKTLLQIRQLMPSNHEVDTELKSDGNTEEQESSADAILASISDSALDKYFTSSKEYLLSHIEKYAHRDLHEGKIDHSKPSALNLDSLDAYIELLSNAGNKLKSIEDLQKVLLQAKETWKLLLTQIDIVHFPAFDNTTSKKSDLEEKHIAIQGQLSALQNHLFQCNRFYLEYKPLLITDNIIPRFLKKEINAFVEIQELRLKEVKQAIASLDQQQKQIADRIQLQALANNEADLRERIVKLNKEKQEHVANAQRAQTKLTSKQSEIAGLKSQQQLAIEALEATREEAKATQESLKTEIDSIKEQEENVHASIQALLAIREKCYFAELKKRPDYELPQEVTAQGLQQHMAWDKGNYNQWQDKVTYSQQINAWRGWNFTYARSFVSSRPLPSRKALILEITKRIESLSQQRRSLNDEFLAKAELFDKKENQQLETSTKIAEAKNDFEATINTQEAELASCQATVELAQTALIHSEFELARTQITITDLHIKKAQTGLDGIQSILFDPKNSADQESLLATSKPQLADAQQKLTAAATELSAIKLNAITFHNATSNITENASQVSEAFSSLKAHTEARLQATKDFASKITSQLATLDESIQARDTLDNTARLLSRLDDPLNQAFSKISTPSGIIQPAEARLQSLNNQHNDIVLFRQKLSLEGQRLDEIFKLLRSFRDKTLLPEIKSQVTMIKKRAYEFQQKLFTYADDTKKLEAALQQQIKQHNTKRSAEALLAQYQQDAQSYQQIRAQRHKWFDCSQRFFGMASASDKHTRPNQSLSDAAKRDRYLNTTLNTAIVDFCNAIGTNNAQTKLDAVFAIINQGIQDFKPSSSDANSEKYKHSLRYLLVELAKRLTNFSTDTGLKATVVKIPVTTLPIDKPLRTIFRV